MSRSRYSRRYAYLQKVRESLTAFWNYIKRNPIESSAILGGATILGLYIIGLALIPGMLFPVVATGAFITNLTAAITCSYYAGRWARQNTASMLLGGVAGFIAGALACTLVMKLIPVFLTYAVCLTVVGGICSGIATLLSAMAANSVVSSIKARERENQRQRILSEREQVEFVNRPPASPEEVHRRIHVDTASSTAQMHVSMSTNPFEDDLNTYTELSQSHTPESVESEPYTPSPDPEGTRLRSESSEAIEVEGDVQTILRPNSR